MLSIFHFVEQTVARAKIVFFYHTAMLIMLFYVELHDSLGAWGGLAASLCSTWRGARYSGQVSFDAVTVTLFFSAVALLHITMPTVLSVDAVTRSVLIFADASQTPGRIIDIGYDPVSQTTTATLMQVFTTIPYLYGQRNLSTVGLPPGLSDT